MLASPTAEELLLHGHARRVSAKPLGTNGRPSRFPGMRIREENCNMVLLAVVTLFAVAIAGGASLLGSGDTSRFADRITVRLADKPVTYVSDQPPVRVIGAPFVPNTNPRDR